MRRILQKAPELISNRTREAFHAERERVANLSIPELIDLLGSDMFVTRFCAEMRLRKLAGL
jgi:hypothetical protein